MIFASGAIGGGRGGVQPDVARVAGERDGAIFLQIKKNRAGEIFLDKGDLKKYTSFLNRVVTFSSPQPLL